MVVHLLVGLHDAVHKPFLQRLGGRHPGARLHAADHLLVGAARAFCVDVGDHLVELPVLGPQVLEAADQLVQFVLVEKAVVVHSCHDLVDKQKAVVHDRDAFGRHGQKGGRRGRRSGEDHLHVPVRGDLVVHVQGVEDVPSQGAHAKNGPVLLGAVKVVAEKFLGVTPPSDITVNVDDFRGHAPPPNLISGQWYGPGRPLKRTEGPGWPAKPGF